MIPKYPRSFSALITFIFLFCLHAHPGVAVQDAGAFTVVVYGDTRTNTADHQAVVNGITQHAPDVVLNSGDLVSDGRQSGQWDVFFDTTKELMALTSYYPVLGNHERNAQQYYDLFDLPAGGGQLGKQWYSFDHGNAHFVCLDSNFRQSAEQLTWLREDLADAQNTAQWIFVVFHHPPYSSGRHGGEASSMEPWLNAFEIYGVDMVFSGHDHTYERSFTSGIWYIVSGGGGAPLYPVNVNPNPHQVYAESSLHFCKLVIDRRELSYEMIRKDGTVGDTMDLTATVAVSQLTKLPVTWSLLKTRH